MASARSFLYHAMQRLTRDNDAYASSNSWGFAMATIKPRRRWFAFSLRSLLVLVTACAIWLGWWVNSATKQRVSVASIREHGRNLVYYDYEQDALRNAARMGAIPTGSQEPTSGVMMFLEEHMGPDYFHHIVTVCFFKSYDGEPPSDDRALWRAVDGLRRLENLTSYVPPLDGDLISLPKLRKLKHLDLMNCPELTDESLRTIARVRSLESLTVTNGTFTDDGFSQLSNLPELKVLYLMDRMAQSILVDKGRAVDISDADIAQIVRSSGLTDLRVSSRTLTNEGLSHLSLLVNLEELDLGSTNATDEGFRQLSELPNLKSLRLNCPQLSDEGLRFIARLPNLERLEIRGSKINGSGFEHFAKGSKLDTVVIESKSLSDEGVRHLAALLNLSTAQLENTPLTAFDLEQFQFAPKLRLIAIKPSVLDTNMRLKQVLKRVTILNGRVL